LRHIRNCGYWAKGSAGWCRVSFWGGFLRRFEVRGTYPVRGCYNDTTRHAGAGAEHGHRILLSVRQGRMGMVRE
jgi:hypothetical protein